MQNSSIEKNRNSQNNSMPLTTIQLGAHVLEIPVYLYQDQNFLSILQTLSVAHNNEAMPLLADLNQLEKENNHLKSIILNQKIGLSTISEEKSKLTREKDTLIKTNKKLGSQQQKTKANEKKLEHQLAEKDNELSSIKREQQNLNDDLQKANIKAQELSDQTSQLENDKKYLQEKLSALESTTFSREEQIQNLHNKLQASHTKHQQLEHEIIKLQNANEALEKNSSEKEKLLHDQIEKLKSPTTPGLPTKSTSLEKELNDAKKELDRLNHQNLGLSRALEYAKKIQPPSTTSKSVSHSDKTPSVESLMQSNAALRKEQEEIKTNASKAATAANAKFIEFKLALDASKEKISQLEAKTSDLDKLLSEEKLRNQQLTQQNTELCNNNKKLEHDKMEYRQKAKDSVKKISELNSNYAQIEQQLRISDGTLSQVLIQYDRIYQQYQQLVQKITQLQSDNHKLKEGQQAFAAELNSKHIQAVQELKHTLSCIIDEHEHFVKQTQFVHQQNQQLTDQISQLQSDNQKLKEAQQAFSERYTALEVKAHECIVLQKELELLCSQLALTEHKLTKVQAPVADGPRTVEVEQINLSKKRKKPKETYYSDEETGPDSDNEVKTKKSAIDNRYHFLSQIQLDNAECIQFNMRTN